MSGLEKEKKQSGAKSSLATDDLPMGPNFYQTIALSGREAPYTIYGYEVNIHASPASAIGHMTAGSSKIQVTTITNQNWELPGHRGNLVASNNQYLVYILEGRNGYVLRVIHQDNNNRALLKGFVGAIVDVAFAHANSNLLACVDQGGNVFLWDLDRASDVSKIQSEGLRVQLQRSGMGDTLSHRLQWAPFVPQEEEEDLEGICIAVSHGNEVDVFDVGTIFSVYSSGMTVPRTVIRKGFFTIANAHEKPICDLSLSPDGSVLATASEDGHLKFWQVDWDPSHPAKCLHDFRPHGGDAVTRLLFCDNHMTQDPTAQFWRFLITGASNNTEVKVWCTVTWKCLQTFRFVPPKDSLDDPLPHIVMALDLSASYLLATDSRRMVLYVLQFYQDGLLGDASVTSVTEYLLTQPILSLVVSGHAPFPPPDGDSGDEGSDEMLIAKEFDSRRNIVLIKVHCIQTRSMQELLVRFEPPDLLGVPPEELSMPGDQHLKDLGRTEADRQLMFGPGTELPPSSADLIPTSEEDTSLFKLELASNGPFSLPISLTPPSSLTLASSNEFQSLPTLTGASPKLVTPSDFASPAKSDPTVSQDTPRAADLVVTVATTFPSLDTSSVTLTSISEMKSELGGSEGVSTSQILEEGGTGAKNENQEPTSIFELPAHPLQSLEVQKHQEQRLVGEGLNELGQPEVVEGEKAGAGVEGVKEEGAVGKGLSDSGQESDEDEGLPPEQVVQQSLNKIFKMLEIENPHAPTTKTHEFNQAGFEEFKQQLLSEQVDRQQILTSTEKGEFESDFESDRSEFVSLGPRERQQVSSEGGEIVNSGGTPAEYLQLLKRKSSPENEMEGGSENPKEDSRAKSPWPDIGGPNLPKMPKIPAENKIPDTSFEILSEEPQPPPTSVAEQTHSLDNNTAGSNLDTHTETEARGKLSGDRQPMSVESASQLELPLLTDRGEEGESSPPSAKERQPPTDGGLLLESFSSETGSKVPLLPGEVKPGVGEMEEGDVEGEETLVEETAATVGTLEPAETQPQGGQVVTEPLLTTPDTAVKSQKKKKRTRGKKPMAELSEVVSHSDGDQPSLDSQRGGVAGPAAQLDPALLSELFQLVARQQQELKQLREEQQSGFALLQQQLESVHVATMEGHRTSLAEYARDQQQKLDKVLREKQSLDKQRQDRLISSVSQTLTTAVNTKLDKLVKSEMKNQVVPTLSRSVGGMQEQTMVAVNHSLATMHATLQENIGRMLQSRGMPEAVGSAVATSLQRTILSSYDEVFKATVLPAFERACQEMFKQIDEAFRRGTAEYMAQLQQQYRQLQEPSLQQLSHSIHSLHSLLTSHGSPIHTSLQASLQQEFGSMAQHLHQTVSETVTTAVQREVEAAIEKHADKLSPEARLQQDRKKKEEDLRKLLHSQELNSAFELALSTSDLTLVMFLCQQVTPEEVFDMTPTPLSQPVLLSLIQQLSVDLKDQLELKIRYLEQSVLALDIGNEVTKSHMPPVLSGLSQQLLVVEKSLHGNPSAVSLARQVKRLRMVAERLCQPHSR